MAETTTTADDSRVPVKRKVCSANARTSAATAARADGGIDRMSVSPVSPVHNTSLKRSRSNPGELQKNEYTANDQSLIDETHEGDIVVEAYIQNAFSELDKGSKMAYDELCRQLLSLSRSQLAPDHASARHPMTPWLRTLTHLVARLHRTHHQALIQLILELDWARVVIGDCGAGFCRVYTRFIETLVTVHPHWAAMEVCQALASSIILASSSSSPDQTMTLSADAVRDRMHSLLRRVAVDLVPAIAASSRSLTSLLLRTLRPHPAQSIADQRVSIRALLRIAQDIPGMRVRIWLVLIEYALELDVELGDVEAAGEDDEEIFKLDEDAAAENEDAASDSGSDASSVAATDDEDSDDGFHQASEMAPEERFEYHKVAAKKLDMAMNILLATQSAFPRHLPVETEHFNLLLDAFHQLVLSTHRARYVQFLMFHWCARSDEYADAFMGALIQEIVGGTDPSLPTTGSRNPDRSVNAAGYIASFVARAQYLPPDVVRGTVNVLVSWGLAYVDADRARAYGSNGMDQYEESRDGVGGRRHLVWYAVVQAIMYVFCFRWRDLQLGDGLDGEQETAEDGHATGSAQWIPALSVLLQLLQSRLAPMRVCSRGVAEQFCRLAHTHRLAYCYPLLYNVGKKDEQSAVSTNRSALAVIAMTYDRLETFFPFDPLRLPRCRSYFDGIYNEWQDDEEDGDSSTAESEDEANSDEVQEIVLNRSMQALSITPPGSGLDASRAMLKEQLQRLLRNHTPTSDR